MDKYFQIILDHIFININVQQGLYIYTTYANIIAYNIIANIISHNSIIPLANSCGSAVWIPHKVISPIWMRSKRFGESQIATVRTSIWWNIWDFSSPWSENVQEDDQGMVKDMTHSEGNPNPGSEEAK
jgi:hypothetical protein